MSKANRKGGYFLTDFDGAVIGVADTQVLYNRVYDDIVKAINDNKPIIVCNLKLKVSPSVNVKLSPVGVTFAHSGESVVGKCSIYTLLITKGETVDYVIITAAN